MAGELGDGVGEKTVCGIQVNVDTKVVGVDGGNCVASVETFRHLLQDVFSLSFVSGLA